MKNDFLITEVDKFEDKVVTRCSYPYTVENECDNATTMCYRHISSPGKDNLVIDVEHVASKWIFLRNGYMIININDVENIKLEAHQSYTKTSQGDLRYYSDAMGIDLTGFDSVHCWESDWYECSHDLLKKICEAQSVDIKIVGKNTYIVKRGNDFIKYSRQFYNAFYDNEAYKEEVYKASSNNGCFYNLGLIMGYFFILMGFLVLAIGFAGEEEIDIAVIFVSLIMCLIFGGGGYWWLRWLKENYGPSSK
jgi:hypothetical protein